MSTPFGGAGSVVQTASETRGQLAEVAAPLSAQREEATCCRGKIPKILCPLWLARVSAFSLSAHGPVDLGIDFSVGFRARWALEDGLFGKRTLFIDQQTWSIALAIGFCDRLSLSLTSHQYSPSSAAC